MLCGIDGLRCTVCAVVAYSYTVSFIPVCMALWWRNPCKKREILLKRHVISNRWSLYKCWLINMEECSLSLVLCPSGRLYPCVGKKDMPVFIAHIQPATFGKPWLFCCRAFFTLGGSMAFFRTIKSKCGTVTLWQSFRWETELSVWGELRDDRVSGAQLMPHRPGLTSRRHKAIRTRHVMPQWRLVLYS